MRIFPERIFSSDRSCWSYHHTTTNLALWMRINFEKNFRDVFFLSIFIFINMAKNVFGQSMLICLLFQHHVYFRSSILYNIPLLSSERICSMLRFSDFLLLQTKLENCWTRYHLGRFIITLFSAFLYSTPFLDNRVWSWTFFNQTEIFKLVA